MVGFPVMVGLLVRIVIVMVGFRSLGVGAVSHCSILEVEVVVRVMLWGGGGWMMLGGALRCWLLFLCSILGSVDSVSSKQIKPM